MKIVCGSCRQELEFEHVRVWPGTPIDETVIVVKSCCANEQQQQVIDRAHDILNDDVMSMLENQIPDVYDRLEQQTINTNPLDILISRVEQTQQSAQEALNVLSIVANAKV